MRPAKPKARPVKRTGKTIRGFAATREPRGVIDQARSDLERGLEDTDRRAHGLRGVKTTKRR